MPSTPSAVLGTFSIDAQWPLTVTPPERTITVSSNALAAAPVQVTDYLSNFGVINITAVIKGVATEGVRTLPGADTGLYFVSHGPAGHQFSYRRAGSAAARMTPADLPLALLARAIAFDDPVTGQARAFESGLALAWPDTDHDGTANPA